MTVGTFAEILGALEQDAGGLSPDIADFYRGLLRIQSGAERTIGMVPPGLSRQVIAERGEKGLPLLTFADLALDWQQVQQTYAEVAAFFSRHQEFAGKVPANLAEDRALFKEAVRAWYERSNPPGEVSGDGDHQGTLETVVHVALKPFLVSRARAYRSLVEQERWRRGSCPICGGTPDFAYLDKENGARHLMCSRCDMDWLFQRLQCPYCNNIDQNTLAYFTDEVARYRLYVCEKCHRYLKALDLRQAGAGVLLPLQRLLTLGLDAQAQQQGYAPPG